MDLGGVDFDADFAFAMGLFHLQNQNDGCDNGDLTSIFNIDNNEWRYSSFLGPVLVGHVLRYGSMEDSFASLRFSLLVYTNSGNLQIAQPILDSPATGTDCSNFMQTQTVAATAGANQFFLDDNFEPTQDVCEARDVSPVCPPPPNCDTASTELNTDTNMCDCLDETHRFVDGSTTMCEPIPPTDANCGANAMIDPNDNTMCVCVDDHRFVEGSTTMCEPNSEDNMEETEMETEMEESQNQQTQPQNNGSGRPKEFAYIGAGVFIVGFAASYISGGGFPIFNYSPDFGYSITENGYAANIGGRADFRKDNWHLYYSANQTNANGNFADFRYESGGKYTADFWTATFSESVSGETADYNFSLSANLQNRIWKISPVYRLHSEYEKGETETQNELNLQGNFRYDGWTILPSAGFRWENANDFSKNARFQINAIHRF